MGRKHCGKRRNCSLRAISPFPTVFSKDLYCRNVKLGACLGKGLIFHCNALFQLGSCSGITVLSLRGNNLTYIPDELGRIPRLRVLNLSSNKLSFLPFTMVKCKELQALWLSENQVNVDFSHVITFHHMTKFLTHL